MEATAPTERTRKSMHPLHKRGRMDTDERSTRPDAAHVLQPRRLQGPRHWPDLGPHPLRALLRALSRGRPGRRPHRRDPDRRARLDQRLCERRHRSLRALQGRPGLPGQLRRRRRVRGLQRLLAHRGRARGRRRAHPLKRLLRDQGGPEDGPGRRRDLLMLVDGGRRRAQVEPGH